MLPHPAAIRVTGISPYECEAKGLTEQGFIARIHDELSQPGTCGVGYNSLSFDDEVTRYTLWRNFYDPYAREYSRGNSRWDLIDVVRAFYALRPDSLSWPLGAAALCAIAFAFTALFTRKLTRDIPITGILFWLALMQGIFGLVIAGYDGVIAVPQGDSLFWVVLVGFAGMIAHFCLTTALSIAPPTVVMPFFFVTWVLMVLRFPTKAKMDAAG